MMGLEYCESLFPNLKTKKMIAGKYLARHFLSIQRALGEGELDSAYWAPGGENPSDGVTKVRSGMAPLPTLLESGHLNPGSLRPLKGAAWKERAGRGNPEN